MSDKILSKRLIFLQLNELNFDLVKRYIDNGLRLPAIELLMSQHSIVTQSEKSYENQEPWIQWVSFYTGKKFADHRVFRLGDIVSYGGTQIFEKLEASGLVVGSVCAMNADNRLLEPAYFIPDPWTKTHTDGSLVSLLLSDSISQLVNSNARSKMSVYVLVKLAIGLIMVLPTRKIFSLVWQLPWAISKKWRRALFLDLLLHEVHTQLFKKSSPNFSVLFLNSGAHIQHHYLLSSLFNSVKNARNPGWYIDADDDPFKEILLVYESIISDLYSMTDTQFVVATGLSQEPFLECVYYYRLNNHTNFLSLLSLPAFQAIPRMTRDFLMVFADKKAAVEAENKLSCLLVDDEIPLFGEIDNRGHELFVVLTYSREIDDSTTVRIDGVAVSLKQFVNFVAIKNGGHNPNGFAFFSDAIARFAPPDGAQVAALHQTVLSYFDVV